MPTVQPTNRRGYRKSPLFHDPEALRWALNRVEGASQAWLAREVDISQGHLSEILVGTRNCPPDLLRRVARALNCPRSMLERKVDDDSAIPA